ncbi:MAG TPA: gliding motility-associated C-terminal domain-containing protein [Chitinophagaceae bacterium]|jgi:gliding motility-associated-like protein
MKKYILFTSILLIHLAYAPRSAAQYSQTVVNGDVTTPINFACYTPWTNDQPVIGLGASGTGGYVPPFTAVNTGSTPITATITFGPLSYYAYVLCLTGGSVDVIDPAGNLVNRISLNIYGKASAVSPDMQTIYIQTTSGIAMLNTDVNFVVGTIPATNFYDNFVLTTDGSILYASAPNNNLVDIFNTTTGTQVGSISLGTPAAGTPTTMALSPDGKTLYVTDAKSGTVHVINTATSAVTANLPLLAVNDYSYGVAVSPDGGTLYVTDQTANFVRVVNTSTNAVITTIPVSGGPSYCKLSPDGSKLYVSNESASGFTIINTATNTKTGPISMGGSGPFGLDFSPDGSKLFQINVIGSFVSIFDIASNSFTSAVTVNTNPEPWGNFVVSPCKGAQLTYTITINPSPAITSTAVSGTIQACAGTASASPTIQTFTVSGTYLLGNITATAPTGFEISLSPGSGYGSNVTLTQSGGTVNNIPVYIRSAASAPAGTPTGNVVLSSTRATSQNVAVSGTVTAVVTPAVPIGASASSICAGTPVTFTATPSNGGTTPVYQWLLNGSNTGTNSSSFNTSTLNNNDQVTCRLTSNAACATTTIANSNIVTMTVTPVVTPSITIGASASSICAGTPVTFTATPLNGGTTPVYQWLLNGSNTGTNSPTFNSSTLNNTDQVSCVLTSNAACTTIPAANSNVVTMTVTPVVTPSITIAASASSICAGVPVTFTATPSNGGTAPIYQWLLNGSNTGINSPTFTSSTLNNADQVSCVLTSNAACATIAIGNSNIVTMTVTPIVTPSITIAASASSICAGSPVTFTATPSNEGTAPGYQWLLNGADIGTNSSSFNTSTLNNTDKVSCVLTSNAACATTPTANSNVVTMSVTPVVTPSITIAASAGTICSGVPVTFIATAVNGGATSVYQWLLNGNNTGTNSPTFNSSTLNNADQVSCLLTSNAACVTTATATGNVITMNVIQQNSPSATVTPSATEICEGDPVVFTTVATNAGTSQVWQWMVNGSNAGNNAPTYTTKSLANGDQVACTVTGNQACSIPGVSTAVTMIVDPLPTIVFTPDTLFRGNGGVSLDPSITGSIASYQWTPDDALSASTIANPVAAPQKSTTYQLLVTTDKGCTASASVIVIPHLPLVMANGFTPNGDGHNDIFRIPLGAPIVLDRFVVFSRSGVEVFSTRNVSEGWDGTYHGQPMSGGTYVYMISGKNTSGQPIILKGTIVLIR